MDRGKAVIWLCWALIQASTISLGADSPTNSLAEAGRFLFQKNCAGCHGASAQGGHGPALRNGYLKHGDSDSDLIKSIREGIPGTPMPPFSMSLADYQAIVAFLRTREWQHGEELPMGDSQKGKELFFGAGQCSKCHMIRGQGGRLGPDLTHIFNERNPGELRVGISQPSLISDPTFKPLKLNSAAGRSCVVLRKT
jgi:cytochrome c oxidase cbb3-type subunit III